MKQRREAALITTLHKYANYMQNTYFNSTGYTLHDDLLIFECKR